MTTLHDFTATTVHGDGQPLSEYAGKVVLVTCLPGTGAFTAQHEGLEQLWQAYRASGLVVLGFRCDRIRAPGGGSDDAAGLGRAVSFPVLTRVDPAGPGADPLWDWLRGEKRGGHGRATSKDFTKYLVDREGRVVRRFGPRTSRAQLAGSIESALARTGAGPAGPWWSRTAAPVG